MIEPGRQAPVDTLEAPHEPAVFATPVAPALLLLLAGPILWMSHFWVVYLLAEASCTAERRPDMTFFGEDGLTTAIVASTIVAVVLCAVAAVVNHRHRSDENVQGLGRIGVWLSIGSAVSVVAVGLPIAVLAPC